MIAQRCLGCSTVACVHLHLPFFSVSEGTEGSSLRDRQKETRTKRRKRHERSAGQIMIDSGMAVR